MSSKKNELTTATANSSAIARIDALSLNDLGYTSSRLDRDENGNLLVTVKDADSKGDTLVTSIEATAEVSACNDLFAEILEFEKKSSIVKCYLCFKLAPFASDNGFSSVGEYLAMNYNLKAGTCNQYKRVAEYFIDCEGEKPLFKYEWCKGVSVANLMQCLSLVKECESVEAFYTEYIASGKLHLRKSLSALKEEIRTLQGKSSKGKGKGEEKKPETVKGEESIETKWAEVCEYLATNTGMSEALKKAIEYINQYIVVPDEAKTIVEE